jgi:hypothetical protein
LDWNNLDTHDTRLSSRGSDIREFRVCRSDILWGGNNLFEDEGSSKVKRIIYQRLLGVHGTQSVFPSLGIITYISFEQTL